MIPKPRKKNQGIGTPVEASPLARFATQTPTGANVTSQAFSRFFQQQSLGGNTEPVIPLPDEEELARVRRRRNARRGGGRASTILSDDAQLGG